MIKFARFIVYKCSEMVEKTSRRGKVKSVREPNKEAMEILNKYDLEARAEELESIMTKHPDLDR
jgi:hypothetical protein